MQHSFDIRIAKKYGVNAAVIFNNLYFWIEKNRANETNFYDGFYWTYNSKKAFAELFPYLNARQIDYALKKLIEDGVVITGNYNANAYDRTLWYAITKKGYSILQNCEMEETKLKNGNNEIVEPIPYSKQTDINALDKTDKEKERKKGTAAGQSNYDAIISEMVFSDTVKETLYEFIKMRKLIKKPLTDYALKRLISKLDSLGRTDAEKVSILEKSIVNNWQDIYELKGEQPKGNAQNGVIDEMQRFYDKYKSEEESV